MTSKRSHEGYLLIDNSNGPGVSPEFVRASGKPDVLVVAEGQRRELPTITCSHCGRVQIINNLRTRARAYCAKCDHYICDACGLAAAQTRECRPFKAVLDSQQEDNFRRQQAGLPLIVPSGK